MMRLKQKIRGLYRNEDGVAAIEFALVSPILVGLFLASVHFGSLSSAQNRMSSSLRFSAQYIANGGEDLSVAERIFETSYGRYQSFSSKISCSCARSRSSLDDNSETGAAEEATSEIVGTVQGSLATAPQCTTDCGTDPVVRFLRMTTVAAERPVLGTDPVEIAHSVSVRLK